MKSRKDRRARSLPRVLFICVENACRSQMAEGFARALGEGGIEACSAGTDPAESVNPRAVGFMKERGIDISSRKPKALADLPAREFDYAVTMGCLDSCPAVPGARIVRWNIPDPKGLSDDAFRVIRDAIEENVSGLLREINPSEAPDKQS